MPNPVRFAIACLLYALLILPAGAASPEDFVKDGAATGTPATPAPAAKPAGTAKAARNAAPMDTAKVHEQYLEGDFDHAIRALEGQLKSKRPMTHAESVFVFKHLGVMYAAQQSTRDKGKYYMGELIHIEPTAKILDMYASDMIHLIFRNVQEEFEKKRARLQPQADTVAAVAQPVPAAPEPGRQETPPQASSASSRKRTIFLAATGATVAVGALALFFLLGGDEPETKTIVVQE